jgi:hypothetical protein
MALFSFSDISFLNKPSVQSSANHLTESSQYQSNIFKYPIDLGSTDKGHYMVIHINEQLSTEFKGSQGPDEPTIFENRRNGRSFSPGTIPANVGSALLQGAKIVNDEFGRKVETLVSGLVSNTPNLNTDNFKTGFTRTIRRTTDTIALYMPDTLTFTHNQSYSDLQLSGFLTAAASGISSIKDAYDTKSSVETKDILNSLSPFLARALQESDLGRALFAAGAQKVVNPMLELIYTSPAFREFRFDFMLYPRSEKEAEEVQKLINRLYFHQAPEINPESAGFFMIPPSEFDIKFYYNGVVNKNIPQISTCVLTSIDVDYAPNGFAAYEVPGESVPKMGRTGMPVAIRLSLQFKETEVLTKSYFDKTRNNSNATSNEVYGTTEGE